MTRKIVFFGHSHIGAGMYIRMNSSSVDLGTRTSNIAWANSRTAQLIPT